MNERVRDMLLSANNLNSYEWSDTEKRFKWTEDAVKWYTHKCVDEYHHITPSAVVLKSNYWAMHPTGWRFDKMRSFVEQEIKIYKQMKKGNDML